MFRSVVAVLICLMSAGALGLTAQQQGEVGRVSLTAGRSTVLQTDFDITRIAITDPAIADATVVQPREVLIDGKAAGTVSLIIWGATARRQYDIVIDPGVSTLEQRLQALFPGEDISVSTNGDAVILSGKVSSNQVSLRMAEIATATASKLKVVNLLQLPGGAGKPAGDAAGPVRRSQPARAARARRVAVHEPDRHRQHDRAGHDAAVCGARLRQSGSGEGERRFRCGRRVRVRRVHLRRLPEHLPVQREVRHRRDDSRASQPRPVPEPGGAESHRLQRAGGELPRRRRDSDSGRAGQQRTPSASTTRSTASA